ncbi:hypothetical protein E6O75_ATG09124 [Venturia nashicola]|uniref:Uncharacterized protein n=1 Tax=Venturia nashicola TaxID=86259 RepID=A0A4Z1NPB4_9PEZI|nr:hypothetical protein E6O75_ATG09124 [Venturia nashicola]
MIPTTTFHSFACWPTLMPSWLASSRLRMDEDRFGNQNNQSLYGYRGLGQSAVVRAWRTCRCGHFDDLQGRIEHIHVYGYALTDLTIDKSYSSHLLVMAVESICRSQAGIQGTFSLCIVQSGILGVFPVLTFISFSSTCEKQLKTLSSRPLPLSTAHSFVSPSMSPASIFADQG